MALQSITNINVDFYDKKYILINAKQLDRGSRFLSVTCYNHGELFNINAIDHSAYIRYRKPDEFGVFNFCEINQGKILVELTEQMLAVDGICYADLVIVNKGDAELDIDTNEIVAINNSSILSTMVFCIDVSETSVNNAEIESSYEYSGLNELLERAEADYTEVIRLAKSYAVGDGDGIRENEDIENAKYYYEQSRDNAGSAVNSMEIANASAAAASASESSAANSAKSASENASAAAASAKSASESAKSATASENAASGYATTAKNSMDSAISNAAIASDNAGKAESFYLQTEAITNGLNGAFSPKGTVTFAELLELKNSGAIGAGDLYHISDNFTTDENFRESGKACGAGTSVYYTVDDKFDYFIGTTVAGVKGKTEASYRTGMVDITPENVGAIPSTDIATVDDVKSYLGI